jgi:hypothetical protein
MGVHDRIVENAHWGVQNHNQIHYEEIRPIQGIHHPHELPLTTDCSGFATDCYSWAGAPDPNGRNYDGLGYTGTMLDACVHISRAEAQPGDLAVFGPGTGEHVVIIVGTGADPQVVSHGQPGDPIQVPLSVEANAHQPPTTFLSATKRRPGFDVKPPEELKTATNPPKGAAAPGR